MRRFLVNTAIFSVPCFLALLLIFSMDVPKFYRYYYTFNEGCSNMYVYDRIFENEKPIDVAFLGTSHTGCAIDGRMIDSAFGDEDITNIAYCQPGENLQYVILKELIENHKPGHVFFEIRMVRDFTTHRDFGTIADLKDVIDAPVIYNQDYFSDLFKAFRVRYMYFQDNLLDDLPQKQDISDFGNYNEIYEIHDGIPPERVEEHLSYQKSRLQSLSDDMSHLWKMKLANHYIRKFAELAEKNDIEVTFLYLPNFGMVRPRPSDIQFLEKYGEVIIPPDSLFHDPSLWMDTEHFNRNGATAFTNWLISTYRKRFHDNK